MRRSFIPLCLVLLPPFVHAHEHDSLGAHEHGVAHLNVALNDKTLELNLESPAINLAGFEHAASSEADKAKAAAVRADLGKPLALFAIPAQAACQVTDQKIASPLFENPHNDKAAKDQDHQHSDIHARYRLTCAHPSALKKLDLSALFSRFPATEKIQVQLIGPQGQQGAQLTATNASLSF